MINAKIMGNILLSQAYNRTKLQVMFVDARRSPKAEKIDDVGVRCDWEEAKDGYFQTYIRVSGRE